jgi:hypothetical protein
MTDTVDIRSTRSIFARAPLSTRAATTGKERKIHEPEPSCDRDISQTAVQSSLAMRNPRVYLDQNIVGYVHEGRISLDSVKGVDWIYSNEHFNEIARSGDPAFLSAFEKLKAQQIEIMLDERFRITDSAQIHPYSSPYERYERHIETINEVEFDESLFTDLLGRLFGAENYRNLIDLPERLRLQVESLLIEAGVLNEFDLDSLESISTDIGSIIKNDLSETRSLESMRKPIGTSDGKIGNPKTENPIQEIWEIVRDKIEGVTAEQFFGFDPIDKQGYEKWPMYLGIVACHTVLNFVGYGADKGIASVKNLPNIMSDANHIATAAFCDAVMSEDRRFCKKASAIYTFLEHQYGKRRTEVLRVEIKSHG